MAARRPVLRRLKIPVFGGLSISIKVSRLWFRSQPVSLKPINSIAILAAVRIPVQMEFSVGTTESASKPTDDRSHDLKHAGDIASVNPKTPYFSAPSEFLVATGDRLIFGTRESVKRPLVNGGRSRTAPARR